MTDPARRDAAVHAPLDAGLGATRIGPRTFALGRAHRT